MCNRYPCMHLFSTHIFCRHFTCVLPLSFSLRPILTEVEAAPSHQKSALLFLTDQEVTINISKLFFPFKALQNHKFLCIEFLNYKFLFKAKLWKNNWQLEIINFGWTNNLVYTCLKLEKIMNYWQERNSLFHFFRIATLPTQRVHAATFNSEFYEREWICSVGNLGLGLRFQDRQKCWFLSLPKIFQLSNVCKRL